MPEGDTLFRIAATLGRALQGKVLTRFTSPLPALAAANLDGRTVTQVEARGKNLLIHFDDGRALHTHLRMTGSWHIYRPGERWQKPERAARAVLETVDFVAVCFDAPVVELLAAGGVERHEGLRRLGPDVLKSDFDAGEARRRLRERGEMAIGDALLAQSALAGIGNVYKSEVLFLCQTDPFAAVSALDDGAIDGLVAKARELMGKNLDGLPRKTRVALTGPRHWVYGRGGQPCLRCGTLVRVRRQGDAGRTTYYCPRCQAVG
jgi:endonuclease-8